MQPDDRAAVIVVGPLGFEPRTASAPGWYPRPFQAELHQDAQILQTRRRPQQPTKYGDLIINTLIKAQSEGKAKTNRSKFLTIMRRAKRTLRQQNRTKIVY